MGEQFCGNCRFWVAPLPWGWRNKRFCIVAPAEATFIEGECRRFPPFRIENTGSDEAENDRGPECDYSRHPYTEEVQWCGEWQERGD